MKQKTIRQDLYVYYTVRFITKSAQIDTVLCVDRSLPIPNKPKQEMNIALALFQQASSGSAASENLCTLKNLT